MSSRKVRAFQALEKILGDAVIRHLYVRECVRRMRRAGCIFIHIPKAAGTSVATATMGRRAGHFSAAEIRDIMGHETFAEYFSFAVTRHPMARLKSAYHYARNGGGSQGGIEWLPEYGGPAFRSFDAFVHEWLVYQDLAAIDYVFRRQVDFVFEAGSCLVDYLGRVEDLREVEQRLTKELGRPIAIAQKNQSLIGTPGDGPAPTAATRRVVEHLYANDFEALGY